MYNIKRGDILYAELGKTIGSEQGDIRPVVVLQNNMGNKYNPTIITASITSQMNKIKLPTHVTLTDKSNLKVLSVVLLEQLRTLDKKRLKERVGYISDNGMNEINKALLVSLGL